MKLKAALIPLVFLAVGMIAGIVMGRRFQQPPPSTIASTSAAESPNRATIPAARNEKPKPAAETKPSRSLTEVRATLANVLSAPSRFDKRLQAVIDAAESVNETEIPEALTLAHRLPTGPLKSAYVRTLLSRWAVRDASAALAWSKELAPGTLRVEALAAVISSVNRTDPAAAFALLQKENVEVQRHLGEEIFRNWAAKDPAAATAATTTVSEPGQRQVLLNAVIDEWASRDLDAATAWAKSLPPGPGQRDALLGLLPKLTASDAATAAGLAAALPTGPLRNDALGTIASLWAGQDIDAAVAWAKSLPEGADRRRALMSLSFSWAESTPKTVAEFAAALPNSDDRTQLLGLAAGQWARSDPQAAADWAAHMPKGEERDRFVAAISSTLAQNSPEEAARLVLAAMDSGYYQSEAITSVVWEWARTSPNDVAQWAGGFPDGPLRDTVMDNLMNQWLAQNSGEAEQWLKGLEKGRVSDSAVGAFIKNLLPSDPAKAAHWAESIDTDNLHFKYEQIEKVAQAWLVTGDPAARPWVEKAPFPEETRARVLAAVAGK